MVDQAKLDVFFMLEEEGSLGRREEHMMEIIRDLQTETASLSEKLAHLEQAILEARSQCRRERGIVCPLYGWDLQQRTEDKLAEIEEILEDLEDEEGEDDGTDDSSDW